MVPRVLPFLDLVRGLWDLLKIHNICSIADFSCNSNTDQHTYLSLCPPHDRLDRVKALAVDQLLSRPPTALVSFKLT